MPRPVPSHPALTDHPPASRSGTLAPPTARPGRLHLWVTAGTLGSLAVRIDPGLGWRLTRAGMDAAQAGAIPARVLVVPPPVAPAAVAWSADRLEAVLRS